jgi:hypothetical protein
VVARGTIPGTKKAQFGDAWIALIGWSKGTDVCHRWRTEVAVLVTLSPISFSLFLFVFRWTGLDCQALSVARLGQVRDPTCTFRPFSLFLSLIFFLSLFSFFLCIFFSLIFFSFLFCWLFSFHWGNLNDNTNHSRFLLLIYFWSLLWDSLLLFSNVSYF